MAAKRKDADPFAPTKPLIVKLASLVIHGEEFMATVQYNPSAAETDRIAFHGLLADEEVHEFITALARMGMLPVKRGKEGTRVPK